MDEELVFVDQNFDLTEYGKKSSSPSIGKKSTDVAGQVLINLEEENSRYVLNSLKNPFVLTIVHGRLGNILFQLGAGLKYAKDNNLNFYWAPLAADANLDYKEYIESNGLFETVLSNLLDSYIDQEFFVSRTKRNFMHKQEAFNYIYRYGFSENPFNYKSLKTSENIVLFGQFYNKYYLDTTLCLNVFSIPLDISDKIKNLYGDVSNFTCIHVRRGDFLNGDGLCLDLSYYSKCIAKFELKTKFIFISDDIEWCEQNFNSDDYIFVFAGKESNIPTLVIDFYLMTECANIICSKSTFSWWGAFLNKNQSKKVLYPATLGDVLHQRVPNDWIKVSVLKNYFDFTYKRLKKIFIFNKWKMR
jgi:hypothetical protein